MKGASRFAVFPDVVEYHATKEIHNADHSNVYGELKGASLYSLCGTHIGHVP